MSMPAYNMDAEQSVLGAMLITEAVFPAVIVERGLRPDHFYRERHAEIFCALTELHDRGEPVDAITACEELGRRGTLEEIGGRDVVANLAATVPAPGSAPHHAKLVVEAAQWRTWDRAVKGMTAAIESRDEAALWDARYQLDQGVTARDRDLTPEKLAELAYRVADGGGAKGYPWPFERLQERSFNVGIRPGQLIVVSGHTHFGKSVFAHQLLDSVAKGGAEAWLYINEMEEEEHLGGILQRLGPVPYEEFIRGRLSEESRRRMLEVINRGDLRWGITPAAGWTPQEVCNHIRLHRRDVVAVDMLHNFPYEDERELSNMVSLFVQTAKLAKCAVVLVCHVNRNRITGGVRPRPTRGDLRGTGDIENKADVVCFVHRDQDPGTYEPLAASYIYFDKYRGGRLGGLGSEDHPLVFDESRIRFVPVEPESTIQRQLRHAAVAA